MTKEIDKYIAALIDLWSTEYDFSVCKALALANDAHKGQRDRGGMPYILHPITVALHITHLELKEEEKEDCMVAALLHDIVEDTPVTLETIEAHFGTMIAVAVDALTKRPGETRMDAAARAKENPIARIVKVGDLIHNMDMNRLKEVTEKDRERMREYGKVHLFLIDGD